MTHTLPLRFSLVLGAMALGLTAFGEPLGPDEALSRALGAAPRKLAAAAPASSYNLVYTQYMPQTTKAGVYVFNHGNSFVAVSADDCAEALLGYADTTIRPRRHTTGNGMVARRVCTRNRSRRKIGTAANAHCG